MPATRAPLDFVRLVRLAIDLRIYACGAIREESIYSDLVSGTLQLIASTMNLLKLRGIFSALTNGRRIWFWYVAVAVAATLPVQIHRSAVRYQAVYGKVDAMRPLSLRSPGNGFRHFAARSIRTSGQMHYAIQPLIPFAKGRWKPSWRIASRTPESGALRGTKRPENTCIVKTPLAISEFVPHPSPKSPLSGDWPAKKSRFGGLKAALIKLCTSTYRLDINRFLAGSKEFGRARRPRVYKRPHQTAQWICRLN